MKWRSWSFDIGVWPVLVHACMHLFAREGICLSSAGIQIDADA